MLLKLDSQHRFYVLVIDGHLYSSHKPETLAMFFEWTQIPMDRAVHSHNFWVFTDKKVMDGFVSRLVNKFDFTFA